MKNEKLYSSWPGGPVLIASDDWRRKTISITSNCRYKRQSISNLINPITKNQKRSQQ